MALVEVCCGISGHLLWHWWTFVVASVVDGSFVVTLGEVL